MTCNEERIINIIKTNYKAYKLKYYKYNTFTLITLGINIFIYLFI